MHNCSLGEPAMIYSLSLKVQKENLKKSMEDVPYASVVGSLMYVQICTKSDITYAISVFGIFQANTGIEHRRTAK